MADRVLLCATRHNFDDCLPLARNYGTGIEIQTFAYPDVLDADNADLLDHYRRALRSFTGTRTMHGPFIDMASGSPDRLIRAAVNQRVRQSFAIANELQSQLIVFHVNFIASLRNAEYRHTWLKNQTEFWLGLIDQAASHGITIALENMWEFEPQIMVELLDRIKAPNVCTCFDVGHAHLFSDTPINEWISLLTPYLGYTHLNNNFGELDDHNALAKGIIDYPPILAKLRTLNPAPMFSLEMNNLPALRESLSWFDLDSSATTPIKARAG